MRSFERSLPMKLMRAREAVMREFRPLLADHDLTEQQWRVLRALASRQPPLEVGELAGATFLLGPSLSRMLSGLEGRSLISRSSMPDDGRRTLVSLTPSGARVVRELAPHSEARYASIEARLGSDRLALLEDLLDEVAHLVPDDDAERQAVRS